MSNLPTDRASTPPRDPSGKLNKPELLKVRRKLRQAAIEGDVTAALALSNYELVDALKRTPIAEKWGRHRIRTISYARPNFTLLANES